MSQTQQFILTAPPGDCRNATAYGVAVAHMAYRVGEHGRLYRAELPVSLRGGLMVLDGSSFDGRGDPAQLCREIIRECTVRNFDGIFCDLDGPPCNFFEKVIARLSPFVLQRGWRLYVTESYSDASDSATVLIPTFISSGSLEKRLRNAMERYGGDRVAVAVQRVAREFHLPAGTDCGHSLEPGELAERVHRFSPAVFFDSNLCTHYFTYLDHGAARFVLFDDSGSLLRKLALTRELGLSRIFLAYPEVKDILPRLLAE